MEFGQDSSTRSLLDQLAATDRSVAFTLHAIIRQAGLTVDEFVKLCRGK